MLEDITAKKLPRKRPDRILFSCHFFSARKEATTNSCWTSPPPSFYSSPWSNKINDESTMEFFSEVIIIPPGKRGRKESKEGGGETPPPLIAKEVGGWRRIFVSCTFYDCGFFKCLSFFCNHFLHIFLRRRKMAKKESGEGDPLINSQTVFPQEQKSAGGRRVKEKKLQKYGPLFSF